MLGRVLYLRQRYSLIKYACVLLMTIGIAMFQMSGKKQMASEGFGGEGLGLVLCAVSLVLDGLCGPQQEMLRTTHNLTTNQQMVVNNFWATIYMGFAAGYMGQLEYGVSPFSAVQVDPSSISQLHSLGPIRHLPSRYTPTSRHIGNLLGFWANVHFSDDPPL